MGQTTTRQSEQLLTTPEVERLLAWMQQVRHVEILQAKDLAKRNLLSKLHERYFRAAVIGENYGEYKRRYEGC